MSKYFLVRLEKSFGVSEIKKSIYEYNTRDEAVAGFHTYMGTCMNSASIESITCVVVDTIGNTIVKESYTKVIETETKTE